MAIFPWSAATAAPPVVLDTTIHHLEDRYEQQQGELVIAYETLRAENAARRAELEANPPQLRDIHLRVSRLTPEQAAVWHQHVTQRKGGNP